MKTLIIIIMACLWGNLNLFAVGLTPEQKETFDMARAEFEKWTTANPGLTLEDYNRLKTDKAPCEHCAAPYALLLQVRKILKNMPATSQMPALGELELQSAVAEFNGVDGRRCRDIYDNYTQQGTKVRLDGQFSQVAEGIFEKYASVASLTYHPEDLKHVYYYYRDSNNHIVEVVIDKDNKASFRVYDYKPKIKTERQKIEDQLPELGGDAPLLGGFDPFKPSEPASSQTFTAASVGLRGHYTSSVHADLVPRGGSLKFIPKDLTLYDGSAEVGYGKTKVTGKVSSAVSKGHQVEFSVVTGEDNTQDALIRYSASSTTDGKFQDQQIIIPLSMNIGTGLGITGEISDSRRAAAGSREQRMVMDFFEPAIDGKKERSEYVTVSVTQQEGQPLIYNLSKAFATSTSTYTTTAGRGATGGYVGVGIIPSKNPNGESIQIKIVNEAGRVAGYATYSRVF